MTGNPESAPKPRFGVLRTIALYKLVKVLLLLAVAYGELRLRDASIAAKLLSWAQARPYGLEHRVVTIRSPLALDTLNPLNHSSSCVTTRCSSP